MTNAVILQLLISSGVLGLIGWGIKRTITAAIQSYTDRVARVEQAVAAMQVKHGELHDEIDDLRENKMDREEAMRENGRMRQTLEILLAGQGEIKGELRVMSNVADAIVALAQKGAK